MTPREHAAVDAGLRADAERIYPLTPEECAHRRNEVGKPCPYCGTVVEWGPPVTEPVR